ncbi:type II methionyl aminopeptidase, partial [Candidatus Woesearchaeota archaeon CG11_big_fil_rev_8_21_14_0_20_43_8]
RWLVKKFNPLAVRMALMQLLREDIIRCYPPLNERAKGLVSQAEHSIIVAEKPIITTKLD